MKKVFAIILSMLMFAALSLSVVGCGEQKKPAEPPTAAAPAPVPAPAPAPAPGTPAPAPAPAAPAPAAK